MSDETTMNVVGGSQVSTKKITVGDKEITLETGRLAKQASGSVVVRSGDTMVLVTAVVSKSERNVDFFPLTVDIEEGMYAAGKIPGGFMKKEGRPSDDAILNARLIDRPIRPMWPEGFNKETHIVATVLSVDGVNPYDTLAMLGASAALSISKAPFQGPLGTVRVGKVEGSWVVNPTEADREVSPIDIIVSGSAEAISMVEAGCLEVSEEEVVAGLEVAHEAIKKQVAAIEEWVREVGVPKMEFAPRTADPLLVDKIKARFAEEILTAVSKLEKKERSEAVGGVKEQVIAALSPAEDLPEATEQAANIAKAFDAVEKQVIRRRIAVDKVRPEARAGTNSALTGSVGKRPSGSCTTTSFRLSVWARPASCVVPDVVRLGTVPSQSGRCVLSFRIMKIFHTPCGWCQKPWSRTAQVRWPVYVLPRWL